LKKRTDDALVASARKGDRAAFGMLVQRYQNLVCAIAYSRLGNADRAGDIAQEAFLVSLENLAQLRSGPKFAPWIRRITHNLCNRWERSETYRRALRAELGRRPVRSVGKRAEDVAERREELAIVRHAMESLPESLRLPLVLHYFEGQTHAETARDLGISKAAVVKRVERAKQHLRTTLRVVHVGFATSQIQANIRKAKPDEKFAMRILGAAPVGSVCGKLGLDALKLGLGQAARRFISSAARYRPVFMTGGGAEMTVGKVILAIVGGLLLAGGATAYLLARTGDVEAEPTAGEADVSQPSGSVAPAAGVGAADADRVAPMVPMVEMPSGATQGQMRGAGRPMVPMAVGAVEKPAAAGGATAGDVKEE